MENGFDGTVSSQVMELKELIAGPLIATVDADALSAQRYLDCLLKIAFEDGSPSGDGDRLRRLDFTYRDRSSGGIRSLSIPFLTIVPLPLLQVQEADFEFNVQILDISRQSGSGLQSSERGADSRLRVALAPTSGSGVTRGRGSSLDANMKVHMKMAQSDVPGGLAALLGIAVSNMIEDVRNSGDMLDSGENDNKQ